MLIVENIGRDMGPLLFSLRELIMKDQYEVVGHFHSKKSIDLEAGGGDRWLDFLMDHLIGDGDNAASILDIFHDPEIGLIFPEDQNFVDIGENSLFVASLCEMLSVPVISETPIFPVGNMFWARKTALNKLFYLNKDLILQPEPLPYDGSYMHAIERILPHLVYNDKLKVLTIYKEGKRWK